MKHITNRTWCDADLLSLKEMVARDVSAARASVALRRPIVAIKSKAKLLGCPFPDDRALRRRRRAAGCAAEDRV